MAPQHAHQMSIQPVNLQKKNGPSSYSELRSEVSSVKGYGVYKSILSQFPYLTDLGVCVSAKKHSGL
jgi:hypothetical protein